MLFLLSNRMKMAKVLFSFIFLVFFSLGVQSQNNKNQAPKTTKTVYSYSFTGVQNEQQLIDLEKQVVALKYVESVKSKFKIEKQAAQLMVIVAIENGGSEEQKSFETAQLKQLILQNNFTPGELSIRPLETQQ